MSLSESLRLALRGLSINEPLLALTMQSLLVDTTNPRVRTS
jgi:hypothetical protein